MNKIYTAEEIKEMVEREEDAQITPEEWEQAERESIERARARAEQQSEPEPREPGVFQVGDTVRVTFTQKRSYKTFGVRRHEWFAKGEGFVGIVRAVSTGYFAGVYVQRVETSYHEGNGCKYDVEFKYARVEHISA